MRPVNLIPPEERRGTAAASRTGRAPYFVLGGLAMVVAMLAFYVNATSSVSNAEAELAAAQVEEREASARADALRPFATFASTRQAREATVASLARSRFDWERVLDELSRVIPSDVWLSDLTASATAEGGGGSNLAGDVDGPVLELTGCGRGHESVAGMITALEDIDGVTRVAVENSSKRGSGSGGGNCQTRNSVAGFVAVVAFEKVSVPEIGSDPAAEASATATGSAASTEDSELSG